MPNEMRKIVFTVEELQAALVNYALRTNKKLPNATIDNILVEGKEGVTATVVYMRDGTEEAKSVEFSPNDVQIQFLHFLKISHLTYQYND